MTSVLMHNIGKKINGNYNTPEEVAVCQDPITFDGVYLNVWQHRELLKGKDITLFVTGNYIGLDNEFDAPMPREKFCDWNQIMDLVVNYGCKLGWHTWSHKDLTKLNYHDILAECTPPFPMFLFAYPYGEFDGRVIEAVKSLGFKRAFTVYRGDNSPLQETRRMIS